MKKLILSCLAGAALCAFGQGGVTPYAPSGEGTEAYPFEVENANHLSWIASMVNSGTDLAGMYFVQTADIDLSTVAQDLGEEGWEPIGGYHYVDGLLTKVGFGGQYDGQGHVVSNLYINRPEADYQGLFGYIKGPVKNLRVENAQVTGKEYVAALAAYMFDILLSNCTVTNSVVRSTSHYAAALCGYQAWGSIDGCQVHNVTVDGGGDYIGGITSWCNMGSIANCRVSGGSITGGSLVGGIAGYVYYHGVVERSCVQTAVKGDSSDIGGLVGRISQGSISACFATGAVQGESNVGGLIGRNEASATSDCYATGEVTGTEMTGGFAGYNTYSDGVISRCYSLGKVTGGESDYVGGFIGGLTGGSIVGCYWNTETAGQAEGVGGVSQDGVECIGKTSEELKLPATFAGWDFTQMWRADDAGLNGGYPLLGWYADAPNALPQTNREPSASVLLGQGLLSVRASSPFYRISCYDLQGRLALTQAYPAGVTETTLPINSKFGECYIVAVEGAQGTECMKAVCR